MNTTFMDFESNPTEHEAYMIEQFCRTGKRTKEFNAKWNLFSKMLKRLFKQSAPMSFLSWTDAKGYFLTCITPYAVEVGSLEQEAISAIYKNATITNNFIIETPYTSL